MSLTNTPSVTVNNITITPDLIDAEMQYHPASSRREAMIKATESLIIGELFKQRAKELDISIEQSNFTNEAQAEDALLSKLIAHEVAIPKAELAECEHFYEQNKVKFMSAPLLEVDHILLASDPEDLEGREQTKTIAAELIKQLQSDPKSFKELARQYSSCPSKESGGNLGQISAGQTVAEFEKALFAADEGLITYPVESRFGHHVAVVRRKVEGEQLPYEAVAKDIEKYLNDKVEHKAIAQYIQILIGDAKIDGFAFDDESSPLVQ